jgi:hypothetical protein
MDESEHKPGSFAVFADFPKFFRQMSPDVLNHEDMKDTKIYSQGNTRRPGQLSSYPVK